MLLPHLEPIEIGFMGEVAERSKAAVLKTVDPQGSGGSNPSLSAIYFQESCIRELPLKGLSSWGGIRTPGHQSAGFDDRACILREGEHRRAAAMTPKG